MTRFSTAKRPFSGLALAQAHLLHLTSEQIHEYLRKNKVKGEVHSDAFWPTLWRRIFPKKLFLIRFKGGGGVIIKGKNEDDACLAAAPFVDDQYGHHCKNPTYNTSCEKCRKRYDQLAEKFNDASVQWIGWASPDNNWVMSV